MNDEGHGESAVVGSSSSPSRAGSSETATAFDADVSVGEAGPTLYYVVAGEGTPDAAVRSVGGEVVTRLATASEVLALAPLAAHSALRGHPDLTLAGPVSIDAERFDRFIHLLGLRRRPQAKAASEAVSTHTQTGEMK